MSMMSILLPPCLASAIAVVEGCSISSRLPLEDACRLEARAALLMPVKFVGPLALLLGPASSSPYKYLFE